jgi:SAM-dependent methyltransferase
MGFQAVDDLQDYLDKTLDVDNSRVVLEAGCGSMSHIRIPGKNYLIGIDISEKQLARNERLDEKIKADLQSYDFGQERFDVVACWDVLEHLPSPQMAMERLLPAIKQGGIFIIAVPNVLSLKGLITKYSPHWFHVFYYRYIVGRKDAGKSDTAPFKTYLDFFISPMRMRKFAGESGFKVEHFAEYDAMVEHLKKQWPFLHFLYRSIATMLQIISLGRLGGMGNSDYIMVLKKE